MNWVYIVPDWWLEISSQIEIWFYSGASMNSEFGTGCYLLQDWNYIIFCLDEIQV
jgi:hypothetical protein